MGVYFGWWDVVNVEPRVIKDRRDFSDKTYRPKCSELIDTDNYDYSTSLSFGDLCFPERFVNDTLHKDVLKTPHQFKGKLLKSLKGHFCCDIYPHAGRPHLQRRIRATQVFQQLFKYAQAMQNETGYFLHSILIF